MSLLLGIDLGTSYFKVGVFDRNGTMRGLGRVRVKAHARAAGWQELEVADFWALLRCGLSDALAEAGARAADIAAVSYSSQANTFVFLDGDRRALTPLVLWTDTRAQAVDATVADFSRRPEFCARAGCTNYAVESAVNKWRWFQNHESRLWSHVRHVMTISDYFTYALTGELLGDASTAAFLGLYDLRAGRWWPEALSACGIEAAMLSRPLRPGSFAANTTAMAESLLGISRGRPLAVGGLDHHVAALGSGLGRFADLSISTGTVLAALILVAEPQPTLGCYHGPHVDGRRFYRLAFDPHGAGQLEDHQRRAAPECGIAELITSAVLENGSSGSHDAEVRAILERINATHRALMLRVGEGKRVETVIATGGATRSADWLQFMADGLGVSIVAPTCVERACFGAAIFASVAAGWYRDSDEAVAAMVQVGCQFEPRRKIVRSAS